MFCPGYRAEETVVGVQARWTLFDSGLTAGTIAEARSEARATRSDLEAVRVELRQAAVGAWETLIASRGELSAAVARAAASRTAARDVAAEVATGQRPLIDRLDSERDALAADLDLVRASNAVTIAAWALNSLF